MSIIVLEGESFTIPYLYFILSFRGYRENGPRILSMTSSAPHAGLLFCCTRVGVSANLPVVIGYSAKHQSRSHKASFVQNAIRVASLLFSNYDPRDNFDFSGSVLGHLYIHILTLDLRMIIFHEVLQVLHTHLAYVIL